MMNLIFILGMLSLARTQDHISSAPIKARMSIEFLKHITHLRD